MTFRLYALLVFLLTSFALLVTSCASFAPTPGEIAGTWSTTLEAVESTCGGFPTGTVLTGDVLFTVEGNTVIATGGGGAVTAGTLNGDTLTFTLSDTTVNGETFEVETTLEFTSGSFAGQSVYTFESGCVVEWDISGTLINGSRVVGIH